MCSCCMYTNTAKESAVEGRGSGHWVHDTIDLTALYDHLLTFVVNLGLVSFVCLLLVDEVCYLTNRTPVCQGVDLIPTSRFCRSNRLKKIDFLNKMRKLNKNMNQI